MSRSSSPPSAAMRPPLARVRGLGSGGGVGHWWSLRLSALALVALSLWLVGALLAHIGTDQAEVALWLHRPLSATLLILAFGVAYYHAALGVQVVVEDYVHHNGLKLASLIAVKFVAAAAAVASIVAVLKLAVGG